MDAIVNELSDALSQELSVGSTGTSTDPSQIFCNSSSSKSSSPCDSYEQAWSTVRYIALGLLLLIGLVIIMAQALGLEFLDAYTVKRAMPRLVAAAVLITLSWPLMGFFVKLTNDLGYGVQQIMYAPFSQLSDKVNFSGSGTTALAIIGAGGAIAALGIFGLLSFAAMAALSVFIAFLVIIIRQLLIVLLVILAPIAIVLMILPNTQKVFKLWYKQFGVALFMFPIITAIIAAGRIFSAISLQGGANSNALDQFIGFAAFYAPYFMLPFTFKLAGGALSSISGSLQNATRGVNRGLSNFRKQRVAQNLANIKAGKRWQGNPVANKVSRGLMNASLLGSAGVDPTKMRGRYSAARSERISTLQAEAEKSAAVQMVASNDDLLTASLHGNMNESSTKEYLEQKGYTGTDLDQAVFSVERARRSMGPVAWGDYAAVANAGTKTGYSEGPAEMEETINRVAGSDRARASRLLAAARSQAERAKRVDLYGSSFGAAQSQMNELYSNPYANKADVNNTLYESVLATKSAAEIASGSTTALSNLTPVIQERMDNAKDDYIAKAQALKTAQGSGDEGAIKVAQQAFDSANGHYKKVMAQTASFQDIAGSLSPDNASIVGEDIIGRKTGRKIRIRHTEIDPATQESKVVETEKDETYGDVIEGLRSDEVFKHYRREYSSGSEAASAEQTPGAPPAAPAT
jgi:hypothetical protein